MGKLRIEDEYKGAEKDVFEAVMDPMVRDEEELFDDLAIKLRFPDYFGRNWNAVWDLLRDFHWLEEKKVVIIYRQLPVFDEEIVETYIRLLADAARDWAPTEDHDLDVYLPGDVLKKYPELFI